MRVYLPPNSVGDRMSSALLFLLLMMVGETLLFVGVERRELQGKMSVGTLLHPTSRHPAYRAQVTALARSEVDSARVLNAENVILPFCCIPSVFR